MTETTEFPHTKENLESLIASVESEIQEERDRIAELEREKAEYRRILEAFA